jgi:hypothetical protein
MMVVGAMKLFAYENVKAQSEKNGPAGITRGLVTFIGVAELAGGLGIVLPIATHIARSLSAKRCPRGNAKDRGRSFEESRLEPP